MHPKEPNFQILLIEREPYLPVEFEILSHLFPVEVFQVHNGLQAIQSMAKGYFPDAIFIPADLDLISPLRLIEWVKSNGFVQDCPIMATGWPEELDILLAMGKAGARQYIIRPYSLTDIQDSLLYEMNQRHFPLAV